MKTDDQISKSQSSSLCQDKGSLVSGDLENTRHSAQGLSEDWDLSEEWDLRIQWILKITRNLVSNTTDCI